MLYEFEHPAEPSPAASFIGSGMGFRIGHLVFVQVFSPSAGILVLLFWCRWTDVVICPRHFSRN